MLALQTGFGRAQRVEVGGQGFGIAFFADQGQQFCLALGQGFQRALQVAGAVALHGGGIALLQQLGDMVVALVALL